MAIPIPDDVRELLQAPSYVHLSTLRADGSPRNWVAWAGLEDDHILVCNPVLGCPPSGGAGPAAFTLFAGMGVRPPAATGANRM